MAGCRNNNLAYTHVNVVFSLNTVQHATDIHLLNYNKFKCKLFYYTLTHHTETKTHYQMSKVMYKKQTSTHNCHNHLVQLQYWCARI